MGALTAKERTVVDLERLQAVEARVRAARQWLVTLSEEEEPPDFEAEMGQQPLDPEVLASLARLRERLRQHLLAKPLRSADWAELPPAN